MYRTTATLKLDYSAMFDFMEKIIIREVESDMEEKELSNISDVLDIVQSAFEYAKDKADEGYGNINMEETL